MSFLQKLLRRRTETEKRNDFARMIAGNRKPTKQAVSFFFCNLPILGEERFTLEEGYKCYDACRVLDYLCHGRTPSEEVMRNFCRSHNLDYDKLLAPKED